MDETGLNYRVLPRRTLLAPTEDPKNVRGTKIPKERVTAVLCANADGSLKVSVTLVGKSANPVCAMKRLWPLPYYYQSKAWVDGPKFKLWLNDVFVPAVDHLPFDEVLLLLDNAPGHLDEIDIGKVRVRFLPPNCTSWRQPMDLGIISAFKARYKHHLMASVLRYLDQPDDVRASLQLEVSTTRRGKFGVTHGRPATLMDAAELSVLAWNEMAADSIRNSFRKADLGVDYSIDSMSSPDRNMGYDVDTARGEMISLLLAEIDGPRQ